MIPASRGRDKGRGAKKENSSTGGTPETSQMAHKQRYHPDEEDKDLRSASQEGRDCKKLNNKAMQHLLRVTVSKH